MEELKKCPWCGPDGRPYLGREYNSRAVNCEVCGAQGPWNRTADQAIAAWNTRANPGVEALEKAREALEAIHGELGLFKMAIEMEDPKAELLERVKMLQEHIDRALKDHPHAG